MSLTSLKDIDREILKHINDEELLRICSIDRKTWNEVCDDNFLRRRLILKYPGIEKYKRENESWKQFFLRVLYYIGKLDDEFKFKYTSGNFKRQYKILKQNKGDNMLILFAAARKGELPMIKYMEQKGYNIFMALRLASFYGHLNIVKYLVEKGANDILKNDALITASEKGNLDVVKYLVKHGADIHAKEDQALINASYKGHLDVVKYLVENGANVHARGNYPLVLAKEARHSKVVEYLENLIRK